MAFSLDGSEIGAQDAGSAPAPDTADTGGDEAAPVYALDGSGGEPQEPEGDPVVKPIVREAESLGDPDDAAPDNAVASDVDPDKVLDGIFGKPEVQPQTHPAVAALNDKIARLEAMLEQRAAPPQQPQNRAQAPAGDERPLGAAEIEHYVARHMQQFGPRPDAQDGPRAVEMWMAQEAAARAHYQTEAAAHNSRLVASGQMREATEPVARSLVAYRAEAKALALAPQDASDDYVAGLAARLFDEEQAAGKQGRGIAPSDYRKIAASYEREQAQRDRAVFDRRMKADPAFARHMAAYQAEKQRSPDRPRLAGAPTAATSTPGARPAAPRQGGSRRPAPVSPLGSAASRREAERVLADAIRRNRMPNA